MAEEHTFINRLVGPHLKREVYGWARIMTQMDKVTGKRSPESVASLVRVLRFTGEIQVRQGSGCPHMFTPVESLQLQAIQALAAWGRRHRGAIDAFAKTTESDTLEFIARSYLRRSQGSPNV